MTRFVLLVLLLGVVTLPQRVMSTCNKFVCTHPEELTAWICTLFDGVDTVNSYNTASGMEVYGDAAFPLLSLPNRYAIMFAGADVGAGRVLVAAHRHYEVDFRYLMSPEGFVEEEPKNCRDTVQGLEYQGSVNITVSGRACQAWTEQTPHKHGYTEAAYFPDETVDAAQNHCRNPKYRKKSRPWCFTTERRKVWEYCDTPACPGNTSNFARNCRRWLTKGQYCGEENICYLDDESSMACLENPAVKILVWNNKYWSTEEQEEAVLQWVNNGGALFWVFLSWPYIHYPPKGYEGNYTKIPFYNVIDAAGIALLHKYHSYGSSIPTPKCADDLNDLLSLQYQVAASKILSVEDAINYATILDQWVRKVEKGDEPEWMYPKLHNRLLDIMAEVGWRLDPQMAWPNSSLEGHQYFANTNKALPVTPSMQLMYKVYYWLGLFGKWRKKAPNVHLFPGDIEEIETESEVIEIRTTGSISVSYWGTGLYLLPAREMTVEVLDANYDVTGPAIPFQISIGCHTDRLYSKTNLHRFPNIRRFAPLKQFSKVTHIHGGLVMLRLKQQPVAGQYYYVKMNISGVIKAPYFNIEDESSIEEWTSRRNAPGMWAHIQGRWMSFTLPARGIRNLTTQHMKAVMEEWDRVVAHNHMLSGKQPLDQQATHWATADIHISVGDLHNGRPIGMFLHRGLPGHKFVLNEDFSYDWGLFHELGHNMQSKYWTWQRTVEVTCNIFALFQQWRLRGEDPLTENVKTLNHVYKKKKFQLFNENPSYDTGFAQHGLVPYAQLASHLGFDCYHKVFKTYYNSSRLPRTDQEEADEWVRRWTETVGYNICPIYEFFYLPLNQDMCLNSPYPAFLPDDIVTQNAPNVTSWLMLKYPNARRAVTTPPDCPSYLRDYGLA